MKIGLISCTKKKRDCLCKAYEIYNTSILFRKAWKYCIDHYDRVYILSAKYGLLDPETIIEPYDESLNNMKKVERMRWAKKVYNQLESLVKKDDIIYFHTGKKYRTPLENWLRYLCFVKIPLEGLGIGQQLAWYSKIADFATNSSKAEGENHE